MRSPDMPFTTKQCLLDAKRLLQERGWYQGLGGLGPQGECCLALALIAVGDNTGRCQSALLILEKLFGMNVAVWNDAPGRTVEEVHDALDRAIIEADEAKNPDDKKCKHCGQEVP